jgi:hypothetical protein
MLTCLRISLAFAEENISERTSDPIGDHRISHGLSGICSPDLSDDGLVVFPVRSGADCAFIERCIRRYPPILVAMSGLFLMSF